MNQFNMSNMEIEEFCEALVLDYIRKYNAPTDYRGYDHKENEKEQR